MEMNDPKLYLCDFGYGILRYDIGRLSILEHHSKEGDYTGVGWGCDFDFKLLEFTRKMKDFLKGNCGKKTKKEKT